MGDQFAAVLFLRKDRIARACCTARKCARWSMRPNGNARCRKNQSLGFFSASFEEESGRSFAMGLNKIAKHASSISKQTGGRVPVVFMFVRTFALRGN